ncbi:MAG TPA: hypothetical protein VGE21_01475 [Flavobacteriales bacterium]
MDLLPESDSTNLSLLQPRLAQLYGKQGTWDEIIAKTMEFPSNMPTLIREMWVKNQEIARANGVTLTPQEFAELFVDDNLS